MGASAVARLAVVLALAGAGCRELPRLPPGACGNFVVDEGEDCDTVGGGGLSCGGPDDDARACRWICDPASAAPDCPAGWPCAPSGKCTHGVGRFRASPAGPVAWAPQQWRLADLDGDGVVDAYGAVAGPELRAVFGDGAGSFEDETRRALPRSAIPRPADGDVDQDGRVEVVVPAPNGLVFLRATEQRSFAPVAHAPYEVPGDRGAWVLPFRARGVAHGRSLLTLEQFEDRLVFDVFVPDGTLTYPESILDAAPGERTSTIELLGKRALVEDLDGDGYDDVVLAFAGTDEVWIGSTVTNFAEGDPYLIDPGKRRLALPDDIGSGALLGADGLLVHLATAPATTTVVRFARGPDGLATDAVADPRFTQEVGFPMATADFDCDGRPDFVSPSGIWVSHGAEDALCHASPPENAVWSDAVAVDVNGDSVPDVVAADRDEAVIHVRWAAACPSTWAGDDCRDDWNADEIVTDAPVSLLRAGNFDGDAFTDVAFRQGDEEVAILFGGDAGRLGPVAFVGRITGLERLESGLLVDGGRVDSMDDLVAVGETGADGLNRAAAFWGAATRTLDAPFALLQGYVSEPPSATVFAESAVVAVAGSAEQQSLWVVRGEPGRPLRREARVAPEPCVLRSDTLWAAGDLDGDGHDEVVGASPLEACPASTSPGCRLVQIDGIEGSVQVGTPGVLGVREPHDLWFADLDRDGDSDLVVVFAGSGGASVLWSRDGALVLEEGTELAAAPDGSLPVAAAALQADDDPALELVVSTGGAIWLVEVGPDGRASTSGEPVAEIAASWLGAADVDRDGLTDVVASDGQELTVLLAVPHTEPAP